MTSRDSTRTSEGPDFSRSMATRGRISLAEPRLDTAEVTAVRDVLTSGHLAAGDEVEAFEAEFADYCNVSHAVATANGTTALHAALVALGIGDGDVVVTTPFTFVATANAIRLAGAEPVFADIDPATYNLDPAAVERVIRARDGEVDAILAVHLYGLPADLDRLGEIAGDYDVPLIEDAAQAHGARHRGQPVGSVGDVGCFSFYPTKNMTTGEGGMITTDSKPVATRAARFIDHGRIDQYEHADVGHNFRLTDVAAAIGRIQLERLPDLLEARRENATRLREGLADCWLEVPHEPDHAVHAYNQFTVRSDRRDEVRRHLEEFGIDTGVYYPKPIHKQPAYAGISAAAPEAEIAAHEVLSLPVHPGIGADEVKTILTGIEYVESYR